MALIVLAIVLGTILGFSAHRASVCTVRAVAEVMGSRRAYMFASVGKSWLWIWAVALPFLWLFPAAGSGDGWSLTATAVLGGFLFGLGAAFNGGCAYSTMARLADGEGRMLAAIAGFALGAAAFATLAGRQWLQRPASAPVLLESVLSWALPLSLILVSWAVYQAIRLWRTRPAGARLAELIFARRYRLSTAAMIMGTTGALLFLLFGPFGYTATYELLIERVIGVGMPPSTVRWVLLLALLAGMLASTLQRGSFRIDWRPHRSWLRNVAGGTLMGFGAAMAPGGNDALVMYGVPTLSPYALPTYVALILGVAAGLLMSRMLTGFVARAEFRDDTFISDSWTRPLPPGRDQADAIALTPPPAPRG